MKDSKIIATLEDVYTAIGFPNVYSIPKDEEKTKEAQAHKRLIELLQTLTHLSIIDRYYEERIDEIEECSAKDQLEEIEPVEFDVKDLTWNETFHDDDTGNVMCYITAPAGLLPRYLSPQEWSDVKKMSRSFSLPIMAAEICVSMMDKAIIIAATAEKGSDKHYCWKDFNLSDDEYKSLLNYCKQHLKDARNSSCNPILKEYEENGNDDGSFYVDDVADEDMSNQLIEDVKYSLFGENGEGQTNALGFTFAKWRGDNIFEFMSGGKTYRLSVECAE